MHAFQFRKINGAFKQEHSTRKKVLFAVAVTFVFGLLFLAAFYLYLIKDLPSAEEMKKISFAQSTVITDREGNELYTIFGDENRKMVPIDQIPTHLIDAVLAIEDDQFFSHGGFDLKAIFRSALENIFHITGRKKGGSTITQQFVKNAFLSSEQTYTRKLKELILAVRIENNFSKEEILEMYLNRVSFGGNAYGAELASEQFFAKDAKQLTLAESSVLASLLKSPTYYSPYGEHSVTTITAPVEEVAASEARTATELESEFSNTYQFGLLGKFITTKKGEVFLPGRANLVLGRMKELGYITDNEAQTAALEMLSMKFSRMRETIKAPHFVMYVRDLLEQKYGKEYVERGGLKVTTTLDAKAQQAAEDAIAAQIVKNREKYHAKNAAALGVNPKTGEILAMVGSEDYWNEEIDGKVNMIIQKRLPGSSFKPIAYAAAFLAGYSPATVLFDLTTDFGNGYKPKNFDGTTHGPVTIRNAMGNSLNIPAVQAGILAGLQNVWNLGSKMGIQFDHPADWYGSAISLGVVEARPIDMAQAYTVFARGGSKIDFTPFLKIEDREGNLLYRYEEPKSTEVLDPEVAAQIVDVLSDPSARGAGWNGILQLPGRVNAVKTGTSNKRKGEQVLPFDGWTIGFTPSFLGLVWVGNADGTAMSETASDLMAGGPIWHSFMAKTLEGTQAETFSKPSTMKWISVARTSGLLPPEGYPDSLITSELFANVNAPTKYDSVLEPIQVDSVSGLLPSEYTPASSVESRWLVNWHSFNSTNPDWEWPIQKWEKEEGANWFSKHGVKNVLFEKPTTTDNVHTATSGNTLPELSILAPEAHGSVVPPFITVNPKISAPNGVQKVSFAWDGKWKDDEIEAPYIGRMRITVAESEGATHTITVTVTDKLGYTVDLTLPVKIGEDTSAPTISISSPKTLEEAKNGQVEISAYDSQSEVRSVELFVNGVSVGELTSLPYLFTVELPKTAFELSAKATDRFGHTAEVKKVIAK